MMRSSRYASGKRASVIDGTRPQSRVDNMHGLNRSKVRRTGPAYSPTGCVQLCMHDYESASLTSGLKAWQQCELVSLFLAAPTEAI
jgi:hypothetical protein